MAWSQESTSHLWGATRLVLCISEPYIERKGIACKLAIDNNHGPYLEGVAEVWKEVNARFLSSMREALACGRWLYVTLHFYVRINMHSKKKYTPRLLIEAVVILNRFRERSPGLKANFNRAEQF